MGEDRPGYKVAQPVLDCRDDFRWLYQSANPMAIGTIGNDSHLWNGGAPQTIANRRHGDHTPWSSDGPLGWVKAIDLSAGAGFDPVRFVRRFLVPRLRTGMYQEVKYVLTDYKDWSRSNGWREVTGSDGADHVHISFRPEFVRAQCSILADYHTWSNDGEPDPHAGSTEDDGMELDSKFWAGKVVAGKRVEEPVSVVLGETRGKTIEIDTAVTALAKVVAAMDKRVIALAARTPAPMKLDPAAVQAIVAAVTAAMNGRTK